MNKIKVPTGVIYTMETADNKPLEFTSIGDYGSNANVKADFLGLTREIEEVPDGNVLPLGEKWVVTISTQHGCPHHCQFCDVPLLKFQGNISLDNLNKQVVTAINERKDVKYTKRLNLHLTRMGEPSWNPDVIWFAHGLKKLVETTGLKCDTIHPVFTTMLPNTNKLLENEIQMWCNMKNKHYEGEAGLQFSINSTSDSQRNTMFNNESLQLKEISEIGERLMKPVGRKYALNFALADGYEVDAKKLRKLFNPEKFMVKITPIHQTQQCILNGIKSSKKYFTPYTKIEKDLIKEGFDVLIFIPSNEEDVSRITCGNAVLAEDLKK